MDDDGVIIIPLKDASAVLAAAQNCKKLMKLKWLPLGMELLSVSG